MTEDSIQSLAMTFFGEILTTEQLARSKLSRVMPKGMEISHFAVLNHLVRARGERTPAQLAKNFHITRGAMTNTLSKLEWAGYIHVRPDWDDARRKMVSISPAGKQACETALSAILPIITQVLHEMGEDKFRATLPVLRELRIKLEAET